MSADNHHNRSDHLVKDSYGSPLAALYDAHRVQLDLVKLAQNQLVIPADELLFLAQRARDLVQACIEIEQRSES